MGSGTYSVLQKSLDQRVDREVVEEISVILPSVTRYDSYRISRGQFGILVSGLAQQEAMAFHRQLQARAIDTEVVADADLPVLHKSFPIRGVKPAGDRIGLADTIGREMTRPLKELVFLAAGYVSRLRASSKPTGAVSRDGLERSGGMGGGSTIIEHEYSLGRVREFRLDLFFWSKPHRMHISVREETLAFFHDQPIRLKNRAGLTGLMLAMADLLPEKRLNQVLRDPLNAGDYPDISDYEEEICWHFHRIGKGI
ncbi:MAG: hypothetical protein ACQCXQ_02775 [Verrucomicrobiales bacterium]|nr:hypothetical protein [Verrucomicrobiota bacterium JB025]